MNEAKILDLSQKLKIFMADLVKREGGSLVDCYYLLGLIAREESSQMRRCIGGADDDCFNQAADIVARNFKEAAEEYGLTLNDQYLIAATILLSVAKCIKDVENASC